MTAHPHPPREAPIQFEPRTVRIALAILLVLGFLGVSPVTATAQPTGFYVEATGHVLGEPFLSYWVDNNGAEILGLPVTDVVSHNGRTAQYFQYGVLVLKRNGAASRVRAGADLLDELRGDPRMIDGRRTPSPRTTQALPRRDIVQQTRSLDGPAPLAIDPDLLSTWRQFGGIATLGEPISTTYRVGRERTQWFEFGRIDLGPDGAIRAEIGRELARIIHERDSGALLWYGTGVDPTPFRRCPACPSLPHRLCLFRRSARCRCRSIFWVGA